MFESGYSKLAVAGEISKEGYKKIEAWAKEGPTSIRFLAFCGGIVMAFNSGFSIIGSILTLSPINALLKCYLVIFGVTIAAIEAKSFLCPSFFRIAITKYAHFLDYLSGRGYFYIFIGSFLLVRWPAIIDFFIGAYMATLGFICIIVGKTASKKLNGMRSKLIDEKAVKNAFQGHDLDANGTLDSSELNTLCIELGSTLTKTELDLALQILDKDRNGTISYEEFLNWWKSENGGAEKGWLNYGSFN